MSTRPILDRRRFLLAGLGATLAACAGTDTVDSAAASPTPSASPKPTPTPSPSPSASASAAPVDASVSPVLDFPTGIIPTRIEIPAINVDAPVIELQLKAQSVEVPEDFDDTGWWVQTRQPGEIGPAVIGGHVDSKRGPAVFFKLKQLEAGDEVTVFDDAGESRTFVVSRPPIQVNKYERPPEVFGFGENRPELRVITCGGDFNPNIGHYVDNIVVFCHDPAYEV